MSASRKVKSGESAELIVWSAGLEDFKAVWGSGDNAQLRQRRPDPNILMPGDTLVLPDAKPTVHELATGARHRVVVHVPRKELRLRVLAHKDTPLANAPYRLVLDDQPEPREGTTDGDGLLKEKVRIDVTGAVLEIDERRFRLRLNYINPFPSDEKDSASGVSSRLAALGYESGAATKASSPALMAAVALYQSDAGIEATGKLDAATQQQLEQDFGC